MTLDEIRDDMLGPRIHWVKFRGPVRFRSGGDKFTPTEPIKMQGRYSGRLMFRVSPEVHRKAAIAAELADKSLNPWAEEVLARATHQT